MDLGTIIGLVAGFGCVLLTMLSGGDARVFLHLPSMSIVIGGTIASSMIHFSMGQLLRIFSVVKKTVFCKQATEQELVQKMVNYSAINRRDGALALEQQIAGAGDDFLVKGLQMVVDGQDEGSIEKLMSLEIQYIQERHSNGKKVLEFMGSSAPAFGMIGTLIGLVQMLGNLEDPSGIGLGMSVALITTFYGAVLANLLFIPLAGKLETRSKREIFLCEMILEGILGLIRGESPTGVREKMQAFVSANSRQDYKPNI